MVPLQWKQAIIFPVPKISNPMQLSNFRHISPISCNRKNHSQRLPVMYPSLGSPPPTLTFADQYVFRSSGSASLIALLQKVTNLLDTNSYVIVIALDFARAFDTVRHSSLTEKVAELNVPDNIYNWITNFLSGHSNHTAHGIKAERWISWT